MPTEKPAYQVKPFPLSRRLVVDSARAGSRRHTISALVEIDVTHGRRLLDEHKALTGESLSFTAFLLTCLGKAVDANKYIHARRDLWGRLILFDDVDCTTLIEIEFQGQKFPLAHIIRAINRRSFRSIHNEVRSVQADPNYSPSFRRSGRTAALFLLLPAFLRDIFYAILSRSPMLFKRQVGTLMISSVGMFGSGSGWGISPGSIYTTDVIIGGIAVKPAMVEGRIEPRQILSVTVNLDHDIVDGAPAARFVDRFKNLVESAYGLEELQQNET